MDESPVSRDPDREDAGPGVDASDHDAFDGIEPDATSPKPKSWLMLVAYIDWIPTENPLPGPDICSAEYRCPDGRRGDAVEAIAVSGGEWGFGIKCPVRPQDPAAATGPLDAVCEFPLECEENWGFYSMGEGGTLFLGFSTAPEAPSSGTDLGLEGCSVTVRALLDFGNGVDVYVCDRPQSDSCTFIERSPTTNDEPVRTTRIPR